MVPLLVSSPPIAIARCFVAHITPETHSYRVASVNTQQSGLTCALCATIDDDLLARRRLGKTHLAVKATQIGTSNATRPENLGPFEYAHLRAPLPKDLKGSEIFPSHTPQQHPETYFLMVSPLPCDLGRCGQLLMQNPHSGGARMDT